MTRYRCPRCDTTIAVRAPRCPPTCTCGHRLKPVEMVEVTDE